MTVAEREIESIISPHANVTSLVMSLGLSLIRSKLTFVIEKVEKSSVG